MTRFILFIYHLGSINNSRQTALEIAGFDSEVDYHKHRLSMVKVLAEKAKQEGVSNEVGIILSLIQFISCNDSDTLHETMQTLDEEGWFDDCIPPEFLN